MGNLVSICDFINRFDLPIEGSGLAGERVETLVDLELSHHRSNNQNQAKQNNHDGASQGATERRTYPGHLRVVSSHQQ